MAGNHQRITPLSAWTRSQIKSSVHIRSLPQVVLELIKNSLDAHAGHITVQVNFSKGYCSVLDDGQGISKEDFRAQNGLGHLYCTSKHLESAYTYGRYGRFLASLADASLLSITSRHSAEDTISSATFRNGKVVAIDTDVRNEELGASKYGTRVVVHNLFGSMPVRIKRRAERLEKQSELDKDFAYLKKSIVEVLLAVGRSVSIDLRDDTHRFSYKPKGTVFDSDGDKVDVENIASVLFAAGFVESACPADWRSVSIQSSNVVLRAAINLQPAPSKSVQFVSMNRHPLPPDNFKFLFDQINTLFDRSSFGTLDGSIQNEAQGVKTFSAQTLKQSASGRKGIDRWPMFYLRIEMTNTSAETGELRDYEVDRLVTSVHGTLYALITEFLKSHGFDVRPVRSDKDQPNRSGVEVLAARDISVFDQWSRIKSGNRVSRNVLSGLPFVDSPHQYIEPSNLVSQSRIEAVDIDGSGEDAIAWVNPSTGNTLHINPRTGIVLPLREKSNAETVGSTHVSRYSRQPRKLHQVAKTLGDYLSQSQLEKPVKSITPDYEALADEDAKFTTGHVCALSGGSQVQISGPSTVEPISLRVTKDSLRAARVLGQVDGKFILASLVSNDAHQTTLILIDQHAADERIKVEELFQQICDNGSVGLPSPLIFQVSRQEIQRLLHLQGYFASWMVHYTITSNLVRVSALPDLIVEKCRLEPKLLINLLRGEIWRDRVLPTESAPGGHWLGRISACPQGILDLLASRACRSAIMFNDQMTIEQCKILVRRLSESVLPFQCAHGRPSLTLIAEFGDVEVAHKMETKDLTFGSGWGAWVGRQL